MSDKGIAIEPIGDKRARIKWIVPALVVGIFILPAGIAFVLKFTKFIRTVGTDELGAIALVPMLNYLAVASGFLCLLAWAILRGMFRDIERPRFTLLENEQMLNLAESANERPRP